MCVKFITSIVPLIVCGSVVDNSLKSPGYPNKYPSSMQCNYTVPIPHGMALNIYFDDFNMEYDDFCL